MTFQQSLIAWYKENQRDLIFRKNKDAYSIWLSEIMAQQTRIEAMLPYYKRFISALPTIEDLAKCDDEKLHKLWEGLGYYSRCKNLKKCAIVCMEQYDGKLPKTKAKLAKLPGIGPYTAGAIASIAYDENVSAIDGNVIRVFSRLFDIHDDMGKASGKKIIEKLVDESLPGSDQISDYNQALMELGALVCIPKSPRCEICPIKSFCKATDPSLLPNLPKKKQNKIIDVTSYVWYCDHTIRLIKRTQKGLLQGLYGFDDQRPDEVLEQIELSSYDHVFSHVTWKIHPVLLRVSKKDGDFYDLKTIEESIAIPSAYMPVIDQLKKEGYLWKQ